jgi:uncharacterized DUF497 family protein
MTQGWRKMTLFNLYQWDDINHKSILSELKDGEERWQTLGKIAQVTVVLVAHTYRQCEDQAEYIAIISARKATQFERGLYERVN